MKTTLLAAALIISFGAASAQGACTPSDIAVDKLKGRVQRNYVYIVGRLLNNCSIATGAEIKVTLYNKAGEILAVEDSWPASINNIPAKSDFPFEHMIERQAGFSNFDVRVIATKIWQRDNQQ